MLVLAHVITFNDADVIEQVLDGLQHDLVRVALPCGGG
jgi:hypothetical protein